MKLFNTLNVLVSLVQARERMYPLHMEHSFRMDSKEMSLPLGKRLLLLKIQYSILVFAISLTSLVRLIHFILAALCIFNQSAVLNSRSIITYNSQVLFMTLMKSKAAWP